MITRVNLEAVLTALGFEKDLLGSSYTKVWLDTGASISVDFDSEKISYPTSAGFKVNVATTCNFTNNENFVVLACVTKLFDKGYRLESIELERQWSLGHEQKSGRADICVNDEHGDTLVIIECKTPGKEYRAEWHTMQSDGGPFFEVPGGRCCEAQDPCGDGSREAECRNEQFWYQPPSRNAAPKPAITVAAPSP